MRDFKRGWHTFYISSAVRRNISHKKDTLQRLRSGWYLEEKSLPNLGKKDVDLVNYAGILTLQIRLNMCRRICSRNRSIISIATSANFINGSAKYSVVSLLRMGVSAGPVGPLAHLQRGKNRHVWNFSFVCCSEYFCSTKECRISAVKEEAEWKREEKGILMEWNANKMKCDDSARGTRYR